MDDDVIKEDEKVQVLLQDARGVHFQEPDGASSAQCQDRVL
jgi:hypothetical protein